MVENHSRNVKSLLFLKKVLYLCKPLSVGLNAPVAELVDALDSKSCSFGSAGSIPARGTKAEEFPLLFAFLFHHTFSNNLNFLLKLSELNLVFRFLKF